MTIFGVRWNDLKLEHVEEFFAGAEREPLTWEAKGTELRREHVTRHVCGFANAAEGGYLLLGFELVDERWRATGCEFPGDDPPVWVSNVVRMTLRPRPRIDVHQWEISEGKRAAVVRVDPVAEPPCVTAGGQLYERVSGETIPVGDPSDVRALYDRGRASAARAEANALRAVEEVAVSALVSSDPFLILALAVAPVGTAPDISAKVFAPRADARLEERIAALPGEPLFSEAGWDGVRAITTRVTQDSVVVETTPGLVQFWRLRLAWDGSAAGLLRASPGIERGAWLFADNVFDDGVRSLASVVEEAARGIGGYGRAHIVLRPLASQFGLRHGALTRGIPAPELPPTIQRWAEGDQWFDDRLLDTMKRELLRACGFLEWEPEVHD